MQKQSTMKPYLIPPYDRGYPWTLDDGDQVAVLSEHAAAVLMVRYDIMVEKGNHLASIKDGALGYDRALESATPKLSKKALKMLAKAGIEVAQ